MGAKNWTISDTLFSIDRETERERARDSFNNKKMVFM